MITKKGLFIIFVAILLVLAGCSSDSEKTDEARQKQTKAAETTKSKEKQKKEEKEDKEENADISGTAAEKDTDYEKYMDTDLEAMMQMEPGEFSGDHYNVEEVKTNGRVSCRRYRGKLLLSYTCINRRRLSAIS
ncbi:hypothetical protein P5G51_005660 [Virgibacillus sp. 179-BFC.A HS]|uniref:Uncharacterized protein n=1 Tax=Tigheibacillus jepli TaxID=3035914 RepID=A0ABU5CGH4_9BACI|nr:hypothetical protein [Virgibacillus sp. 179-BFC.A HS]MDY0404954.1 hypothetical protein [Virgibacillus sp. 179-BFC.A HS]